ncbi:MAG: hypothetical protein JW709_07295 [Sedimentisphaerales bacterium]|nr:hypothetical protein [Sedimentisphaerales bacterium]
MKKRNKLFTWFFLFSIAAVAVMVAGATCAGGNPTLGVWAAGPFIISLLVGWLVRQSRGACGVLLVGSGVIWALSMAAYTSLAIEPVDMPYAFAFVALPFYGYLLNGPVVLAAILIGFLHYAKTADIY